MESIEKVAHRINPVSVTGLFRHAFAWGGHVGKKVLTRIRGDESPLSTTAAPVNVYLVHGTVDMASGCHQLAQRLQESLGEHIHTHCVEFTGRFQGKPIEEYAAQLRDTILEAQATRVVLIGHSRGGLVAAFCALHLLPKEVQVLQLHAIGSPLRGTITAGWASTALAWLPMLGLREDNSIAQMQPQSEFIRNLRRDLLDAMLHSRFAAYFYAAGRDALVHWENCYPVAGLSREHLPDNMSLFGYHSHISIMSSRVMAEQIAGRIASVIPEEALASKLIVDSSRSALG